MTSGARERPLRIATRGSALARWQAEHVARALGALGRASVSVVVRTTGDEVQDVPLARIGGRGLFTKEVDDALLEDRADLAVHSAKDLPTVLAAGLEIVALLERAHPADALVVGPGLPRGLSELPRGTRLGTSSLRRRAQLAALRPDLDVVDLRGNVDTRLLRVHERAVDATILARAGLDRLGRYEEVAETLEPPAWLPAVGQGALAVVAHGSNPAAKVLRALDHPATRVAVAAERAFLRRLEGGCQVPIGALARLGDGALELHGGIFALDGTAAARGSATTPAVDVDAAGALGLELAERLLAQGGNAILVEVRAAAVPGVAAP